MRKSILTFSLILLSFFSALAQKTGTIRGFVYDKMNEDPVPFANLVIAGTQLLRIMAII
jgi:hypothetical protein